MHLPLVEYRSSTVSTSMKKIQHCKAHGPYSMAGYWASECDQWRCDDPKRGWRAVLHAAAPPTFCRVAAPAHHKSLSTSTTRPAKSTRNYCLSLSAASGLAASALLLIMI